MTSKFTYKLISREESEKLPSPWRHCVHVMIHSPVPDVKLFNNPNLTISNTVLMMMRHDGRLGFPGGFVDYDDASLEHGAYRELTEEMGIVPPNFEITLADYKSSHCYEYNAERKYCLHFFIKEVTFDEFLTIETRNGKQDYAGFEVLGPVRVPLYVMRDNTSGFPAFLRNNFIGNAKEQLLDGIRSKKLLSDADLDHYIALSQQGDPLSNTM